MPNFYREVWIGIVEAYLCWCGEVVEHLLSLQRRLLPWTDWLIHWRRQLYLPAPPPHQLHSSYTTDTGHCLLPAMCQCTCSDTLQHIHSFCLKVSVYAKQNQLNVATNIYLTYFIAAFIILQHLFKNTC